MCTQHDPSLLWLQDIQHIMAGHLSNRGSTHEEEDQILAVSKHMPPVHLPFTNLCHTAAGLLLHVAHLHQLT